MFEENRRANVKDIETRAKNIEKELRRQRLKADRGNMNYRQSLRDFIEESERTGTSATRRIFQLMGVEAGARKKRN